MAPFIIIFILLISLCVIELSKVYEKMLVPTVLIFTILFLLAGLRPEGIDKDYSNYASSFYFFGSPLDYFQNFTAWVFFEPLHYLIPSIIKTYVTADNYLTTSMVVFAFFGVGLKLYGIKKLTPLFFQATLIYFSYFYLLHEMTQIRAGIAAGIFLICIALKAQKKYLAIILLILCSTLLHYSSLVLFVIFFVNNKHINKKLYVPVMAVTLLLAVVNTSFVLGFLNIDLGPITYKSSNYLEMTESGDLTEINKLNVVFLLTYISTAAMLFFSERIAAFNNYVNILLKLQIIGLFLFELLSAIPSLAFRISDLFFSVQIITFTYFGYLLKNRFMGLCITVLIAIGFLLLNLVYLNLIKDYL